MSKRKLRNNGITEDIELDSSKVYKYNTSGALVEATSISDDDIVVTGSKSSLRRISDLERNLSILAAKTQTEDGDGSGDGYGYVEKAGKWYTARTISLGGDLSGSVSIDGSSNVTLNATIAANSLVLGTDTTGNYMVNVTAGSGISVSHTQGEGSTATISSTETLASVTARGATTSAALSTGALTVSGAITATGEVTAYYSDVNLKKDIVEIGNALSKVEAIRGVHYRPNETALGLGIEDKAEVGVIAQEIEAVLPELVVASAFEGYKTVKYDKLTALLIEAVKELSAEVKTLKAQVGKQA
jgi:hypothetical protein